LFGGETKKIDGSDAKDPRIAYVANGKDTPGGNEGMYGLRMVSAPPGFSS
jgi:hypothetical protein